MIPMGILREFDAYLETGKPFDWEGWVITEHDGMLPKLDPANADYAVCEVEGGRYVLLTGCKDFMQPRSRGPIVQADLKE